MNKLEELIQKLCPIGVEYKKISEVCQRQKGIAITAGEMKKLDKPFAPIRIFAAGNTVANVDYGDIPNSSVISKPSIIVKSRGNIGFEYYTNPFTHKNEMWSYSAKSELIRLKFVYYFLQNHIDEFQLKAKTGKLPQISICDTDDYKIPIPPIEVQEEIVRILDKFTELSAELSARKKQYNYFCDKLLTQSNHISYKKVKDLAKFTYGFTDKAKDAGNVRYIRITDIDETGCLKHDDKKFLNISENNHSYLLKKGDLVMARTGATFGKTLYFEDNEPSIYASFLIKIELDNNKILNRFYWHFSKSSLYWEQANNLVSTGGQPQFNTGAIGQVVVPVPPLEEQERIVAILDRFDKICNDISEGLPAEIEARQKQYEYYRDKLLTFEEIAQ